jgi:hypothetical protein
VNVDQFCTDHCNAMQNIMALVSLFKSMGVVLNLYRLTMRGFLCKTVNLELVSRFASFVFVSKEVLLIIFLFVLDVPSFQDLDIGNH